MYGFYDPAATSGTSSPPFHPAFLADLARRRGDPLEAFETYRKEQDPNGLFCNDLLREKGLCDP